MPRPRSLIVNMSITTTARTHSCRHSEKHRLSKGDLRLTIKSDGDEHHYCIDCARRFLKADIINLQNILTHIENLSSAVASSANPLESIK